MWKPLLCRLGRHRWKSKGITESGHLHLECRCGAGWLRRPPRRG
jgi:hypothetical protein